MNREHRIAPKLGALQAELDALNHVQAWLPPNSTRFFPQSSTKLSKENC